METKDEKKAREKAAREAAQLAFFQRLVPSVPAEFCDHGPARCSAEKHQLILKGVKDEDPAVSLVRALVMTVPTGAGLVYCRCCRTDLVCDHSSTEINADGTIWCIDCGQTVGEVPDAQG